MSYKFYIQRYSRKHWNKETSQYDEEAKGDLIDIEEHFKCKYVKFEGLSETGKVKNIYTETYAETEELRMYIPDEVLYDNTDMSLTLLFAPETENDRDVQDNERAFFEYVSGRKIEYHDTFRNRYVSLLLLNKPEVVGEVLYGGSRYREVKYTFKNIYGRSFATSKIS